MGRGTVVGLLWLVVGVVGVAWRRGSRRSGRLLAGVRIMGVGRRLGLGWLLVVVLLLLMVLWRGAVARGLVAVAIRVTVARLRSGLIVRHVVRLVVV